MRPSLLIIAMFPLGLILAAPTVEAADVRMYVRHEVNEYATWRKAYDAFDPERKKMGVTAAAVFRSVDDPNDVTVTHDFKSVEKAKALASSDRLKDVMKKAGVKGPPQIWFTSRAMK